MKRRETISLLALSATLTPPCAQAGEREVKQHRVPQSSPALAAPIPFTKGQPIPVAFLLSEGAEVVDFSGPWGVFEYVFPPDVHGPPFQLYTVAESTAPLKVSGGMTIVPNYAFDNAPQPKLIVVPAMGEPSAALLEWLKQASQKTDLTMSVCNGAFVLAKAGLLAGKAATSHHGGYALLAADFPDIKVKRGARFVDDGKISTAGGLTSGIDLALHIVERYFGRTVAEQTATSLEYQGQGWKNANSNGAFSKKPVSTEAHPICPICEMEVDKTSAQPEMFRGRKYYFCMEEHRLRFIASPSRFIS